MPRLCVHVCMCVCMCVHASLCACMRTRVQRCRWSRRKSALNGALYVNPSPPPSKHPHPSIPTPSSHRDPPPTTTLRPSPPSNHPHPPHHPTLQPSSSFNHQPPATSLAEGSLVQVASSTISFNQVCLFVPWLQHTCQKKN